MAHNQQEQKAEAKSPKKHSVATIPWIPKLRSTDNYQKLPFFQQMWPQGPNRDLEGKRRHYLYWLLNQTFPLYLPKRYHSMDCKSLHENSKEGQYWGNASHFLYCNQAHGHIYFHHLENELKLEKSDLTDFTTAFYSDKKDYVLEDGLSEQCKTAAEFLLEPWVLIQLPFQPVLMHQWGVALLAEAFRFHKEIADFYSVGYPKRLQGPVKKLFRMYEIMLKCAEDCLRYFALFSERASQSIQKIIGGFISEFFTHLPEVLPVIEFVNSNECIYVIRSVQHLAWNDFFNECIFDPEDDLKEYHVQPTIYNREFWRKQSEVSFLIFSKDSPQEKNRTKQVKVTDAARKVLKNFIHDTILKSGKVKMKDSEEKLSETLDYYGFPLISLLHSYNEASGVSSRAKGPEDLYYGVIYDLIRLYADFQMSKAMGRMISILIFNEVLERVYKYRGSPYSLSTIVKILSKVKSDDKWRYQKIMERVKATCFSPTRQSYPDYNKGAENVAAHFQERIRNLIFKMIEKQYKTLKGKVFYFYPECQFAQYILPCFVATFLDIEKNSNLGRENKEKFLSLVHELVSTYERFEFAQKITSKVRKDPFAAGVLEVEMEGRIYDYMNYINEEYTIIDPAVASVEKSVLDPVICKGLEFLTDYSPNFFLREEKVCLWLYQNFMFFCRMRASFGWVNQSADKTAPYFMIRLFFGGKKKYEHNLLKPDSIEALMMYKFSESESVVDVDGIIDEFDCYKLLTKIPRHLKKIVDDTPVLQLIGVAVFHYVKNFSKEEADEARKNLQHPAFPLDVCTSVIWSLTTNDFWSLKQHISTITQRVGCEDPTLASLQFAKSNLCYESALKTLTPEGRVEMSKPGEITFFPVKHCRWCGRVDLDEFRVCPECEENPEYPDINFFCSEKCEKECLETQHTEEHCQFLVNKLGINSD